MEECRVAGKVEHFQRGEPLQAVIYFGGQSDFYKSSVLKIILKKLVTMNAPIKNLFFFLKLI